METMPFDWVPTVTRRLDDLEVGTVFRFMSHVEDTSVEDSTPFMALAWWAVLDDHVRTMNAHAWANGRDGDVINDPCLVVSLGTWTFGELKIVDGTAETLVAGTVVPR